ncbi:sensor histidine kinase [Alkalihalobacillus sp. LMS39]|uniref:sensor histidine kinase n=1 Tax=Alkalihalobacillus sp. LMS39 TaxID=2924032 RepID=UPI001FB3232E|nr:sensor histidine kinase [Alkalihalobacillus sp. LMS39]UOE93920.1 sensor histidine kinase [Alkalihalobacillus sp. LMS39]
MNHRLWFHLVISFGIIIIAVSSWGEGNPLLLFACTGLFLCSVLLPLIKSERGKVSLELLHVSFLVYITWTISNILVVFIYITMKLFYLSYDSGHTRKTLFIPVIIQSIVIIATVAAVHTYIEASYIAILYLVFLLQWYLQQRWKQEAKEKEAMYRGVLREYKQQKYKVDGLTIQIKEEERQRIARNLHDSLGHSLAALVMQLEGALIQYDKPEGKTAVEQAKNLARETLSTTRQSVHKLYDEPVSGVPAVIQLLKRYELEQQFHIEMTVKPGVHKLQLNREQAVVFYRTVQEALTNVMKHAKEKKVSIYLTIEENNWLVVEIQNERVTTNTIHEGFGLTTMRQRVEQCGGYLALTTQGETFILQCKLPIQGGE